MRDNVLKPLQELGMEKAQAEAEIQWAAEQILSSEQLLKCSANSLFNAVLDTARMGLSLNPSRAEAYLTTKWDKVSKSAKAYLEPSYRGLTLLAAQSCGAKYSIAHVVYSDDDFVMPNLLDPKSVAVHKPSLKKSGEPIGAYSQFVLPDGTALFEYMTIDEIKEVRSASQGWQAFEKKKIQATPWHNWFGEMARKTVVRRHIKYLPKYENTKYEKLMAAASAIDSQYEFENTPVVVAADEQENVRENARETLVKQITEGLSKCSKETQQELKELLREKKAAGEITLQLLEAVAKQIEEEIAESTSTEQ